jgi:hypothetical protein
MHQPSSRFAAFVVAIMMVTLLVQTATAAATTVPLGTAGSFAILAGTAITDVPTSTIDGDVGLSPTTGAAITGLTCAEVTGTIYTVDLTGPLCRDADAGLLTTAKNAVTTAYNDAASRSPDATFAEADNQLGGKALVAGVYRFTAASTANLTGNLTLTGGVDDVWIFQATSTLVTAASSTITFSGGAQACNVFWQVGSAATLGASSSFAGTILAHDDISLGSQATVDGRLLAGGQASQAGAVTLIMDTIIRSDCASGPTPTATAAPGPTATAAPGPTATAAPGATPTAGAGATPTVRPTAAAARGGRTAAPSAPSTDTMPDTQPGPSAPVEPFLLVACLVLLLLAAAVPGGAIRARNRSA